MREKMEVKNRCEKRRNIDKIKNNSIELSGFWRAIDKHIEFSFETINTRLNSNDAS